MDKNLVIGNTSQLSQYFPDDYVKISSRDIDWKVVYGSVWDRVYICFGESRKFIEEPALHDDINYHLTVNIIEKITNISKSIVVYSTCELWNKHDGQIHVDMPFNCYGSPYVLSKWKLSTFIKNSDYGKVIVLYPFNFNSTRRNDSFLFGKIFSSIIHKKKITIGDTYFYRDIVHPKFVVEQSIKADRNEIVGSGRLTFVNDFIRDLYSSFKMDYNEYVTEEVGVFNEYEKRTEYYLKSDECLYSYNQLLCDTVLDIQTEIESR